ncbi:hypothetical protein ABIA33_000787 [Streptacidiphilus sp. MAP12-16]
MRTKHSAFHPPHSAHSPYHPHADMPTGQAS